MVCMFGIGVIECTWLASDPSYWTTNMEWPVLLKLGALPMASILSLGLMIQLFSGPDPVRCAKCTFLSGFELFGLAALFAFVACARLFTHWVHQSAVDLLNPYVHPGTPAFCWSFITLLLLPQLLIAALGGWIIYRYQISISIDVRRRRYERSGSMLASPGL
jgi:hypothetical protein